MTGWQVAVAVLVGVPIGFQLGLTGTGGALLAVPLLVYVVGVTVQQAVAMSLIIVAASALVGVWTYAGSGHVNGKAAVAFGLTGMVGAWVGAYGHRWVEPDVLLILFGVLLLASRALTLIAARATAAGPPGHEESCAVRFPTGCWGQAGGVGWVVGVLNGFFGVGGGFLIVTALVLALRFPSRLAAGTSLLTIALISSTGVIAHLQAISVSWTVTLGVMAGSGLGMILGARLWDLWPAKRTGLVGGTISVVLGPALILVNTGKRLGLWT